MGNQRQVDRLWSKYVNLVVVLVLLVTPSPTFSCPESCYCLDDFVTCTDFKFLDLTMLPRGVKTLALTSGEVEEIPPGFFAMGTDLKILELISVSSRVVRGFAFAGLNNLELFTITNSSFDIVEPDCFSRMSNISRMQISESKFGRVGKHAFAYLTDTMLLNISDNYFRYISEEVFYNLRHVHTMQFYHNNISYIAGDVFMGAADIDYVNFYNNHIATVAEGSFENIASVAVRMELFANLFQCSCDLVWMLTEPTLTHFLGNNQCYFPNQEGERKTKYRLTDITSAEICPSGLVTAYNEEESSTDTAGLMSESSGSSAVTIEGIEASEVYSTAAKADRHTKHTVDGQIEIAENVVDMSEILGVVTNSQTVVGESHITESVGDSNHEIVDAMDYDRQNNEEFDQDADDMSRDTDIKSHGMGVEYGKTETDRPILIAESSSEAPVKLEAEMVVVDDKDKTDTQVVHDALFPDLVHEQVMIHNVMTEDNKWKPIDVQTMYPEEEGTVMAGATKDMEDVASSTEVSDTEVSQEEVDLVSGSNDMTTASHGSSPDVADLFTDTRNSDSHVQLKADPKASPVREDNVNYHGKHARPYSTSANRMSTRSPENGAPPLSGSVLFLLAVSLFVVLYPSS